MNKVIAMTGHRSKRIPHPVEVQELIREVFQLEKPSLVIQGMAEGIDIWSAKIAWQENIPYESAQPWAGHSASTKEAYQWVLRNSAKVTVLNPSLTYPGAYAYENRNRYMIDNANHVLAVWDGIPKGGTFNAVKYAREKGKLITRIHPTKLTIETL